MIGKIIGILLLVIAGLASAGGFMLAVLTLFLLPLVFRGEWTWFNWFCVLSIPIVMLLFFVFVWRLDPWGATTAVGAWQNRTGPRVRERMATSPLWKGLLWVGIACQILYLIVTILKVKDLVK